MSDKIKLQMAIDQISAARDYTKSLLDDIHTDDWFRQSPGETTHVGWQVGHLAMAQYGLALYRQRGRKLEDAALMNSPFRKKFSRGTTVSWEPDFYPSAVEILSVFNGIHDLVMMELTEYPMSQLNETVGKPYAAYPTKLGCLLFCAHHEMLHAGQIGLLRRLLGKAPIR